MREKRTYTIYGRNEDLDKLEEALAHIDFLGRTGSSRNILIRVDGDGDGHISVINEKGERISSYKSYNTEQNLGQGALVGIYDIG